MFQISFLQLGSKQQRYGKKPGWSVRKPADSSHLCCSGWRESFGSAPRPSAELCLPLPWPRRRTEDTGGRVSAGVRTGVAVHCVI